MNAIEIFNEATILTCFYICYLFTNFVPDSDLRYTIGWCFMGFIFTNLAINFGGIVVNMVIKTRVKIRAWLKRRREKKNQVRHFDMAE
jgi:hypothetical protein